MKPNRFCRALAALTAALCLTACAAPAAGDLMKGFVPAPVGASGALSAADRTAVADFSVRLLQHSLQPGENVLISPISALSALAMTANGAAGETLTGMETAFGLERDALNGMMHSYLAALPQDAAQGKLSLANSVWIADLPTLRVHDSFLQTNADYYGADVFRLPFDGGAAAQINNWVRTHTDGMIEEILDAVSRDAVLYLVNALAFSADWATVYRRPRPKAKP